jgi:hypothetical protein
MLARQHLNGEIAAMVAQREQYFSADNEASSKTGHIKPMLSSHSTKRDQYGVPVIPHVARISFAGSIESTEAQLKRKP